MSPAELQARGVDLWWGNTDGLVREMLNLAAELRAAGDHLFASMIEETLTGETLTTGAAQ